MRHHCRSYANPKYRSKNAASLSSTVRFLAAWPLFFENRDTGGRIFVMAMPVVGTLPPRKALSMKLRVASGSRFSSAMAVGLDRIQDAVGARIGLEQPVSTQVFAHPQGVERSGIEAGQEHIDHDHQVQLAFFRRCDKSL
jgi:hypothetical protein